MTDVLTKEQRSRCMSSIRGSDTKPEIIVRKLIHGMGYRYRIHGKDLPGRPDIILPKYRKIIFVHGCFWHMHDCQYGRVKPQTNTEFWESKRQGNVMRDLRHKADLESKGWKIFVVWECWTRDLFLLKKYLSSFLS